MCQKVLSRPLKNTVGDAKDLWDQEVRLPGEPGQTGPVDAVIFCFVSLHSCKRWQSHVRYLLQEQVSIQRWWDVGEEEIWGLITREFPKADSERRKSMFTYTEWAWGWENTQLEEHSVREWPLHTWKGGAGPVCQSQRHLGPAWCMQMWIPFAACVMGKASLLCFSI